MRFWGLVRVHELLVHVESSKWKFVGAPLRTVPFNLKGHIDGWHTRFSVRVPISRLPRGQI